MSAHLLSLAIGPVQEFISAARRTRDLWFGSFLLSTISAAAARSVSKRGRLIFPAEVPYNEDANVANVILAELPPEEAPDRVAAEAKDAAEKCWREFADKPLAQYARVVREEIWREQVEGVLEFYAAWVPYSPDTYRAARGRLSRLLGGRKNCRNFSPGPRRPGVPKSSLDGLRETVLVEGDRARWPRSLRVRAGEQLDVVGLVKRTGRGDDETHPGYPSVSRVAADSWLRGAIKAGVDLKPLVEACKALGRNVLHRIDYRRLSPGYAQFPYEGTAVYRTRHREMVEESGIAYGELGQLLGALGEVEAAAAKAGLGREPDPYLAVLVADGDRIGEAIASLLTADDNRDFSRTLAGFAAAAANIVREHNGVLVYAGGDDVLAFLPLDTALQCARALREDFCGRMRPTTLSVGVAIGHLYEDMEDLLNYGRAAEKEAKRPDRDGLAVHLYKRGGAPVKVRRQWGRQDDENALDNRLERYARWFLSGAISGRTPYELHRLADFYDGWPTSTLKEALQKDAVRVIQRKQPRGKSNMAEISRAVVAGVEGPEGLRALAEELLIARQVAVGLRQSGQGVTT